MIRETEVVIHRLSSCTAVARNGIRVSYPDYLITWGGVTWPVVAEESGFIPVPSWKRT
jgi:hypothetical protein